jgi:hypothetical protein
MRCAPVIFLGMLVSAGCLTGTATTPRDRTRIPIPDPDAATSYRPAFARVPPSRAELERPASLLGAPPGIPLAQLLAPKHIPDRLLVKIKPSEIANPYHPAAGLEGLRREGLLPFDLGLRSVEYVGVGAEEGVVVALQFNEPIRREEMVRRLQQLGGRMLEPVSTRRRSVVAGAGLLLPRPIGDRWIRALGGRYPQLKPGSVLDPAFRTAGVLSMRRIFRGVERPTPRRPGYVSVRRFRDVLDTAKRAYPARAARAYRTVDTLPGAVARPFLLEPGHAQRIVPGVSLRDRVTGRVRTGEGYAVAVADNMENWFLLRLAPGADLQEAMRRLQRLSVVERVELDYPLQGAATTDPEWANQWGLKNTGSFQGTPGGVVGFDVNIEPAWSAAAAGRPVVVAVMDTGFKEDLDELRNRLWTNTAESAGTGGVDDDCNGYVDDVHGITTYDRWIVDYGTAACGGSPGGASEALEPHGTMVASVIAAEVNTTGIAGVAGTDNVDLMNVTLGLLTRSFPPGWAEFAEGMAYAISPSYEIGANVATLPPGADVVNMSFSCRGAGYLASEIALAALDNGLVLVAATGNGGLRFIRSETHATGVFPASLPGVIAVGGANRMDRRYAMGNYGPGLDLVAPAEDVRVLTYDETNPASTVSQVITAAGTSFAAAFVSGGAATVLARYPEMTSPYMLYWLRAKARDMLDPNGDGVNDPGDDEWSGAGMLNVGNAVTSMANANDRPIEVGLSIQRASNSLVNEFPWFSYAAAAFPTGPQPTIGVRVQGSTLQSWALAFGAGDAPTAWTPVSVGGASTSQPRDFTQSSNGTSYGLTGPYWFEHTIAGGVTGLDTDALANKQIYTLRLTAVNRAGTSFTTYDWFVPERASILFPPQNLTMLTERGWPPIGAYIDMRPSADYRIDVLDGLDQVVWTHSWTQFPFHDTVPRSGSRGFRIIGPPALGYFHSGFPDPGPGEPAFPDPSVITTEGWHTVRLTVNGPAGTDQDSLRLYVDRSNFAARYWGLQHEPIPDGTGWLLSDYPMDLFHMADNEQLKVIERSTPEATRVLVATSNVILALDGNGALVWEYHGTEGRMVHFSKNFVVGDIDNDGEEELIFATREVTLPYGALGQTRLLVHVLRPSDGTPFSTNWPLELEAAQQVVADPGFGPDPEYVAIADVAGGPRKEIVLTQFRSYYTGVAAADVSGPRLRVVDRNGLQLWERTFPVELPRLNGVRIANIDSTGKEEIVVVATGEVLHGDNTPVTGWTVPGTYVSADVVNRAAGDPDLVFVNASGSVELKTAQGTTRPGWPVPASSFTLLGTAQVVAGGDEETILCDTQLRVLDTAGANPASWTNAALNGQCLGMAMEDVNGDNIDEILVLVRRWNSAPAPTERVGNFLEAYTVAGTRLADTDARWPIDVPFVRRGSGTMISPHMHRQVTIGDADGDGSPEVLQLQWIRPWTKTWQVPNARIEVLDLP